MPQQDKAGLRALLRERRKALSPRARSIAARSAAGHAPNIPDWHAARRIGLYLDADGELETGPLAELCRQQGKALFLPVIHPDQHLSFAPWNEDTPLHENRFGIPEPPREGGELDASALDILFLPLVGWDNAGGRLGMGGGFYDRSLARGRRPLLVGLAHALQEVAHIPGEPWDVSLDAVLTDEGLRTCRRGG